MKTFGRVILLIVGGILVGYAIPQLITCINFLNSVGWKITPNNAEIWNNFITFLMQCADILGGTFAIFGAILGKSNKIMTIYSLVMIGFVIWYFVDASQKNLLGDWKNILKICLGFACPIFYFLGSLLVRL